MKGLKGIIFFMICSFFVFSCVSKSKYTKLSSELDTTQAKAQDLEDTLNASKMDFEKLKKSKEEFEKTCQEWLSAKENLEQEKQVLEQKTETYSQLVDSLKDEIEAGEVTISQMKDRLTVNLIDKVLFDSGRATVKPSGQKTLGKVAEILKDVKDKRIYVNGHTDNVPIGRVLQQKFPTNWELSTARATAVVRYLEEMKVPQENMVAAGYSMFQPVASNDSEKGRQENRRIEIALVPKPLAEKPIKKN